MLVRTLGPRLRLNLGIRDRAQVMASVKGKVRFSNRVGVRVRLGLDLGLCLVLGLGVGLGLASNLGLVLVLGLGLWLLNLLIKFILGWKLRVSLKYNIIKLLSQNEYFF
jgi:hypothetical protein